MAAGIYAVTFDRTATPDGGRYRLHAMTEDTPEVTETFAMVADARQFAGRMLRTPSASEVSRG